MGPTLTPVKSSNISALGYDPAAQKLAVKFKGSGQTYHYDGVAQAEYDKLAQAPSIGTHFHQHVRGKFQHRKVSDG